MTLDLSRAHLAQYIDHTLLAPETTSADVLQLVADAVQLGVYSICISPSLVEVAAAEELGPVRIATVCGFPSGKHLAVVKAAEAAQAVAAGAHEVDMVMDIGALCEGRLDLLEAEIRAVREAVPDALLKVIIEAAVLNDAQIVAACHVAEAARADYVKTSTGFHAAGGASIAAVQLMRRTVGDRLGVKASGGIRDHGAAIAMIEAGASRLGLSGTAKVLAGCPTT